MESPIRPTDDDARSMARGLLTQARFAALGVLDPETGGPFLSRIAIALVEGQPVSLISSLSAHARALGANGLSSLLVGEPETRGDPLTHPRLTLQTTAHEIARDHPDFGALREAYLAQRPKSKLYIDFADFYFIRFDIARGFLNGGFGKAFVLTPDDLTP